MDNLKEKSPLPAGGLHNRNIAQISVGHIPDKVKHITDYIWLCEDIAMLFPVAS